MVLSDTVLIQIRALSFLNVSREELLVFDGDGGEMVLETEHRALYVLGK